MRGVLIFVKHSKIVNYTVRKENCIIYNLNFGRSEIKTNSFKKIQKIFSLKTILCTSCIALPQMFVR